MKMAQKRLKFRQLAKNSPKIDQAKSQLIDTTLFINFETTNEGASKVTILEYSPEDSGLLARCEIIATSVSKTGESETFERKTVLYPEPKRDGIKSYWEEMDGPKGVRQKITYSPDSITITTLEDDNNDMGAVVERTLVNKGGRIVKVNERTRNGGEREYSMAYNKKGHIVKFGHNIFKYDKSDDKGNWLDRVDMLDTRVLREITYR